MKKFKPLLSAFLPVMAALAIQVAASLIVTVWFSVFTTAGLLLEGVSNPEQMLSGMVTLLTDPLFNDILLTVTYIALTVVFILWYRKQKEKPVPAAFDEVFCIRNLAIYLIAGLAAQITISMCLNLILPLFPQTYDSYLALLESLVGGSIIVAVLATVVMAPIAEEIIFRELMTRQLRQMFPFWLANIIQALAFGVYHMNIVQGVYAFMLGLLLGYVAYRMRSVWASIMLHGIVNASGLVLDIILPGALFESPVGMIMFAVLCCAITILLTLLYRFPDSGESIARTIPVPNFPASAAEAQITFTAGTDEIAAPSDDPDSSVTESGISDTQQSTDSL